MGLAIALLQTKARMEAEEMKNQVQDDTPTCAEVVSQSIQVKGTNQG